MAASDICNCKMNVELGRRRGNIVTMILAILTQEFIVLPDEETIYELEVSPLECKEGFLIKVLDSMPANIALAIEAHEKEDKRRKFEKMLPDEIFLAIESSERREDEEAEEAAADDRTAEQSWPVKGRAFLRNQTAKGLGGIPVQMLMIVAETANLVPDKMIYAVRVYPGKPAFTLCFETALGRSSSPEMDGMRADQRVCAM